MFLRSCLYERQDETKKREWMIKQRRKTSFKKAGVDDKTEKENLFHHFFVELLLEHVNVN